MRVSFVSDIHGNVEGLAAIAAHAEQLVVLGDLLDYVDYHEPHRGILGEIFGGDRIVRFAQLRSQGDFLGLRSYNRSLWDSLADPIGTLTEVVAERYRQMLAVIPDNTLLILGNVDVEAAWDAVAGDRMPCRDGEVVNLAGRRFGFVAGGSSRPGLPPRAPDPVWQPYVRPAEDYTAAIGRLGPVDVLCSHIPPRLARLRYDTIPARLEMFGPGLLEYIDEHQPRFSLFGHVHQPLGGRQRRGHTECVNVGHFQRFPKAFELDLDEDLGEHDSDRPGDHPGR